ncbi:MAG: hypothetical protein V4668_03665 [Patescibacteria group bacterium]
MISSPLFIRLLTFFGVTLGWYFSILLLAFPLTLWYLLNFKAYELIALGMLIDMYFMPIRLIPVYTICFAGAFIIIEIIKPRFKSGVTTI